MKKTILVLTLLLGAVSVGKINAQLGGISNTVIPVTPGGLFDKVFDKDGNSYNLYDLAIRLDGSGNQTQVASSTSCQAGFFSVYFANGSGMETASNATHTARRNTVCEVLSNLSGFLGYSSST